VLLEGLKPRPSRPSWRSSSAGPDSPHRHGRSAAEDGGAGLFWFAMQSRALLGGGKQSRPAVAGCRGLPVRSPS